MFFGLFRIQLLCLEKLAAKQGEGWGSFPFFPPKLSRSPIGARAFHGKILRQKAVILCKHLRCGRRSPILKRYGVKYDQLYVWR